MTAVTAAAATTVTFPAATVAAVTALTAAEVTAVCNGCHGGGHDGGVYVMVNSGVVVGAAASTEPTKPSAPAAGGNGRTSVGGTIHTMSLE